MSDKEEAARLMNVLRSALRILGLSNREIERRLDYTPSYLSRVFDGSIEFKVWHVLEIAWGIGLRPAELFQLAYPGLAEPPSEAFSALQASLQSMLPPRPAPAVKLTPEEIDRRIQESVRRAFMELAEGPVKEES